MDFRRKDAQDKSCKLGLAEADDRCFLTKNLSSPLISSIAFVIFTIETFYMI